MPHQRNSVSLPVLISEIIRVSVHSLIISQLRKNYLCIIRDASVLIAQTYLPDDTDNARIICV